jgi:rhodanese-related sulfurtransferase
MISTYDLTSLKCEPIIIDVRTKKEFEESTISGSFFMPEYSNSFPDYCLEYLDIL